MRVESESVSHVNDIQMETCIDEPHARASAVRLTITTPMASAALARFHSERPSTDHPARLHQQLAALAEHNFSADPSLATAMEVLDCLFNERDAAKPLSRLTGRDFIFAANLLRLPQFVAKSLQPSQPGASIHKSNQSEDCLADDADDWSVFRILNLAAMGSIPASRRAAIVTSVRNEGLSILEWLAHHRAAGFDAFYVYSNDNTDCSWDLLRTLADHGLINLIENEVSDGVRVQAKILEHSLHLLPELRAFEWVFYIDVDEFFMSRCEPGLTLDAFFRQLDQTFPASKPSAVCFNWKWFGSENAFRLTDGLLLERFVYSIHNEHVKSLVRLRDVLSMRQVHIPILMDGAWLANSQLERTDPSIKMKPIYATGQLNHYWNKSFEEFMLKRARGRISAGLNGAPLEFASFFDWGANSRRGNFDPPQERVLDRVKPEYRNLLDMPGVEIALQTVRARCKAMLEELDSELGIEELYQRRGRPV